MRTRTCLRSARSPSISSRSVSASAAAFLTEAISASAARASARSLNAASRSPRSADTNSTARRIRSSRLASESNSDAGCGIDIFLPLGCGLFERRLGLVHQRAKRRRIGQRHVRQNFAIQFHAGLLQPIHEFAVGNFSGAAGCPDAHNPQRAEIALLEPAALIAVAQRLLNRLLCGSIKLTLGEEKTFGEGKRLLAAITPLSTTFNSWHVSSPWVLPV